MSDPVIRVPRESYRFRAALKTLAGPNNAYRDHDGTPTTYHDAAWDTIMEIDPSMAERCHDDGHWEMDQALIKYPTVLWMGTVHFDRDYLDWAQALQPTDLYVRSE